MNSVFEDTARILVVDDEPRIREILAEFLEMEGFRVETASNGAEALVVLSRGAFDVVISDLKMPEMGGLELLAAIREHTPDIVSILMTGFGTVETAIESMKRGAFDYILKPFKMDEVIHTVRRGLEQARLRNENMRLRETLSLYKVTEALSASLSVEAVLETLASAATSEIPADHVNIYLEDGEGGFALRRREMRQGFALAHAAGELSIDALSEHLREHDGVRVHRTECIPFFSRLPSEIEAESLLAIPLKVRGRMVGVFACVSYAERVRFSEGQRKMVHLMTDRASASMDNATLYENLRSTFHETIKGLASALDKLDRYTAGHSERVAAFAQLLAIKVGLDDAQVEIVRQSALMHDIGKIGCVLKLNKPGRISTSEYEEFKRHPGYGRDILQPISFLHPLIPGVHLHHERWDGMGYPLGLKEEKIPIIARIISVADTYDAMTSDRAYRKALPHEVAVKEIVRCSGTQFDPDIAESFGRVIEGWYAEQREPV